MKNRTSQSGFTLIELIAVMVILGILAAVIIPRISTITSGAYESNVRAMYGLIKNEVNAQALKAAMSGGVGGHLEQYPNPTSTGLDYYLKEWVDDYDPDMWSQFLTASLYAMAHQPPPKSNVVLFMYHPHGKPTGSVTWGSNTTAFTGSATSLEDFYWIYYAPRTSSKGALAGRSLDGFVMAAWKGSLDKTFNGTIAADGTTTNGAETVIDDLTYMAGN